jgi:hypothetical protein
MAMWGAGVRTSHVANTKILTINRRLQHSECHGQGNENHKFHSDILLDIVNGSHDADVNREARHPHHHSYRGGGGNGAESNRPFPTTIAHPTRVESQQ